MSTHTPGPWRWWPTASGARIAGRPADGSKNFVCDVLHPELAVHYLDNARLIASAPELLAELRKAREVIQRAASSKLADGTYFDADCAATMVMTSIDAAIAKATGSAS
jgi:hypothetical protein